MTSASRKPKLPVALCLAMLWGLQGAANAEEESGARKTAKPFAVDVKKAGKQLGRTAKKVGKDIGQGTAKAARTVKREFREDFVEGKDDDGPTRKKEQAGRK